MARRAEADARIANARARLDALRPLAGPAIASLQRYYDVELTYTSNAIEGNTLTHRETAEVIEHGITVGGKRLREHLEAVDHFAAVQWVRALAARTDPLDENVMRELHRRIVARSEPEIAGIYSTYPRRIAGSATVFPNAAKIPALMAELGTRLARTDCSAQAAFDGHFRLVAIHPFADGNGRTGRLLMNLMLLRGGYVPVAVQPADREAYLDALERSSLDDAEPFQAFMSRKLADTLDDYLRALER